MTTPDTCKRSRRLYKSCALEINAGPTRVMQKSQNVCGQESKRVCTKPSDTSGRLGVEPVGCRFAPGVPSETGVHAASGRAAFGTPPRLIWSRQLIARDGSTKLTRCTAHRFATLGSGL